MLDLKFLHAPAGEAPLLAVLYQDLKSARHIKTYRVSLKDKVRCPPLRVEASAGALPLEASAVHSACAQPRSRACTLRQEQHSLSAWRLVQHQGSTCLNQHSCPQSQRACKISKYLHAVWCKLERPGECPDGSMCLHHTSSPSACSLLVGVRRALATQPAPRRGEAHGAGRGCAQELHAGPWAQRDLDGGALKVIAIPLPLGGAVVLGENVIAYFHESQFPPVVEGQPQPIDGSHPSPICVPISPTIIKVRPHPPLAAALLIRAVVVCSCAASEPSRRCRSRCRGTPGKLCMPVLWFSHLGAVHHQLE